MINAQYEIIKVEQPKAPPISLIRVSGDRNLTASLEAFGPNSFNANVVEMQKKYSHPQTGQVISFREPTTSDSILIASYEFEKRAKLEIFNPRWLQAGRIIKTPKGIFANPPKDNKGNIILDKQILNSFLEGVEPVKVGSGKIYVVPNAQNLRDFGFAEYDSFVREVQEGGDFANGGLARILEHTEKPAENLKKIASKKNYPNGVNVLGFDPVEFDTALRVAGLDSDRNLDYGRLHVGGYGCGGSGDGCAFGVLD